MLTLYGFPPSPYVAKVRAILRWKGLAFDERNVHPVWRRELERISGARMVPVLDDGEGHVIADSSRIARFLDEKWPARSILPSDRALRARALVAEEWADEALPKAVQPVRWLIPANRKKMVALFRGGFPPGLVDDLVFAALGPFLAFDIRRRYAPRSLQLSERTILNELARVLDILDDALAETGWLAGPEATVADFAVWGFLHFLDGLDGWETVKAHRRVARLLKTLGTAGAPEAYDAEDAALLDASHHRQSHKRLPLL
jgi:glutathione S-transferase